MSYDVSALAALLHKHEPKPGTLGRVGMTPRQVRAALRQLRAGQPRVRRQRTVRAKIYGMLKFAVAHLPPAGITVPTKDEAEKLQCVARRMGIKLAIAKCGPGEARRVTPALTAAEVSRDCSGL